VAGLLLAAGEGRRYGRPKALVDSGSGPWVRCALETLAGLDSVAVVVGAAADEVAALLSGGVAVVRNPDYRQGMGSSLAAGLRSFESVPAAVRPDAVLVMLVDLPDVGRAVVDRVAAVARSADRPGSVLARASYGGRPGHPVLIGAEHVAGVLESAAGDSGARSYLGRHQVQFVECADIGGGRDVDVPER
jgi:CTP:molybdopterin cytidylyltransferase MocA